MKKISMEKTSVTHGLEEIKKKAGMGVSRAQCHLAGLYFMGYGGVSRNIKIAAKWYHKAALGGDAWAQLNLAMMYAEGMGMPKNYVKAYAWLTIINNSNNTEYVSHTYLLPRIKELLTRRQMEEGQALSRELFKKIEMNKKNK